MEELLNSYELNEFLTNYLKIRDWKLKYKNDKWDLLKLLTKKYGTHPKFSFQNVTMASLDPNKMKAPTKQDSKMKCLNGKGGMCIEHNYYFASLLYSIGYDTYIAGASVSLLPDIPLCHPICIVRMDGSSSSSESNKLLMIDYGMGAPFPYEPIPLHELPYSYMVGGYKVEYRMSIDGICQRVHIKGDPLKGEYRNEEEEIRTVTNLKPMKFEEFENQMTIIFTHVNSFFLNTLYAFRYIKSKDDEDFKAVIMLGKKVIQFTKNTMEPVEEFEQYEDIFPIFEKFFPDLSMIELKKAIQTFRRNNLDVVK